jgi:hypothetical protein
MPCAILVLFLEPGKAGPGGSCAAGDRGARTSEANGGAGVTAVPRYKFDDAQRAALTIGMLTAAIKGVLIFGDCSPYSSARGENSATIDLIIEVEEALFGEFAKSWQEDRRSAEERREHVALILNLISNRGFITARPELEVYLVPVGWMDQEDRLNELLGEELVKRMVSEGMRMR